MWKEVFEGKIIRVEGLMDGNFKVRVKVDERIVADCVLELAGCCFALPIKSFCSIEVWDLDGRRNSVRFNSGIIGDDGVHWLPIMRETEMDIIENCPDEVNSPRILVLLHKRVILDSIIEDAEKSEVASACEDDYMPEIKLCSNFAESGSFDEYQENDGEKSQSHPLPGMNGFSQDKLHEKIKNLEKLIEVEKNMRKCMQDEIEYCKKVFNDEIELCKNKEEELIEEIKKVETQASEYRYQLLKTKAELSSAQNENSRLSQLIKLSEHTTQLKINEYSQKLEALERSIKPETSQSPVPFTQSSRPERKFIKPRDEETRRLISEINALKSKVQELTLKIKSTDELEDAVQRSSRGTRLAGLIKKDKEQIYIYNNIKISMMLKDGQLLCRIGGSFKPFNDFINSSLQIETGVVKIFKSPSDLKQLENKGRTSPLRKANTSFISSGSKSAIRGSIIKKD